MNIDFIYGLLTGILIGLLLYRFSDDIRYLLTFKDEKLYEVRCPICHSKFEIYIMK